MKPLKFIIFALFCLTSLISLAKIPELTIPKLQDFYYKIPLSTNQNESVYSVTIPSAVYEGSVKIDLEDVRIFNSSNTIVPHAIQSVPDQTINQKHQISLKSIPLWNLKNKPLDNISLKIQRNPDGSVSQLTSIPTGTSQQNQVLVGYLLDASQTDNPINQIYLKFKDQPKNFFTKMRLEYSNDLDHWSTLMSDTTIARFQRADHQLERNTIDFSPISAKYYRITWNSEEALPDLEDVVAHWTETLIQSGPVQIKEIVGHQNQNNSREYLFDTGGHYPTKEIQIQLPQKNTLVRISLESSNIKTGLWRHQFDGLLYDMTVKGHNLSNPRISSSSKDRYWKLTINQQEGGLGAGQPKLKLYWQSEKLIFVAQGEGPFVMAYGNGKAEKSRFHVNQLLGRFSLKLTDLKIASPGDPIAVKLKPKLPTEPKFPTKKFLLWAVMGVGVVLLGFMAIKLFKQINHTND